MCMSILQWPGGSDFYACMAVDPLSQDANLAYSGPITALLFSQCGRYLLAGSLGLTSISTNFNHIIYWC